MTIKFPQSDKRILVTNGKSSFRGTISYTKNIDLDEEGVIKLSAPMVKIFSSEDNSNFNLPVDVFSYNSNNYKVITGSTAFNFNGSGLAFTADSGTPTFSDESRVITWNNGNWFINADQIYEYSAATGTTVYTARINDFLQYLTLFNTRNSVVGASANIVTQYDDTYANTIDLELPENYVVKGMAYSNQLLGIATRQKKNQGEAYFFTWDGRQVTYNSGYPVGDSYITSIKAYKGSWVLFTAAGKILYFNGGGFEELAVLPSFNNNDDLISLSPTSDVSIGENIDVLDDIIYINIPSLPEYSSNDKAYRPHFSGGIYCFDPKVGLYHRHSPSYSDYVGETGTSASNIITLATHYLETGDEIYLQSDSLGLTGGRFYYAIKLSSTTISLADSYSDSIAGTAMTITDGSLQLWFTRRKDYGYESIRLSDLGVCKSIRSYENYEDNKIVPFFLGTSIRPNNVSSSRVRVLNALAPMVSNRGYFVMGRYQAGSIETNWKAISIKYGALKNSDKIIVKVKSKDVEPLIIGDSTLFNGTYTGDYITWSDSTSFSTAVDLSSLEEGDEVHVFDGAGAGQSAHIVSTQQGSGVWIVTLDEDIRGVSLGLKSCVSIDKWKKIGSITPDDVDGVKRLEITEKSPDIEVKIELRGVGVKIKEITVIEDSYKPQS